ncbi:MAG TPA: outer membrane beta-barrel protein [Candidatus Didemnitutus sp.]|nr:outer membrane beta-barrel protein [Candidatus Didemnitutus sp.]
MKNFLLIAIAVLGTTVASAQKDSTYSLDGTFGGGYVYNITSFPYGVDGLSRNGFNGFARVLWNPETILSVGLEIGYTNLYSVDPPEDRAIVHSALVAYPFYLVLSMEPVDRFSIAIGYGMAMLSSVVDDGTSQTGVTSASTSVYGALQYLAPIDDRLKIGGEARFTSIDRYRDMNLSFNVLITYSLIRY